MLPPIAIPDTPEWHAGRRKGIGASEAAAAAGLSTYETPLHLYARKRGEAPAVEETAAMRLGKRLEPVVIAEFCDETGLSVAQAPCGLYQHTRFPFVLATPDAMLANGELLEAKTTTWRQAQKLGAEGSDELPTEWVCQAQQQMAVLDVGLVHLAVLLDGRTLKTFRVERNDRLIDGIVDAEAELWDRIQAGNPPEPEWNHPRTPDLIKSMRKTVGKGRIAATAEMIALWEEIESLGRIEKDAKEARELKRAKFLHLLGDRFAAVLPGGKKMVRQACIEKKSYTVAASMSLDMRAVNYDGGEIEDCELPVRGYVSTEASFDAVHAMLLEAGYVHYETSDSGSRYYVTDDGGERVRVADHGPNAATAAWMERRNVREIRIDAPEFDARVAVDEVLIGVYA